MPTEPIYFGPAQESGAERLSGAMPVAINVVVDGRGVVRRRPCIAARTGIYSGVVNAEGVRGLHVTEGGRVYAVGGSTVYRLAAANAQTLGGVEADLVGDLRPTFAETEALLVIAAGNRIQKIDLATGQSSRLGGDPPYSSHVVANSLALLGNDLVVDRSKIRYSDISQGTLDYSGHESWTFGGVGLSGFFTAEARPDPVVAIGENTNEVFVWGTSNVQVFAPDQGSWAPVGTREYGCSAPYSIIKSDQDFAWLDHRRRFVISDGRTHKVLSEEIQPSLDDMADVSDCYGYRVRTGPVDALVWTFPTDGRTFAYQQGGGWAQWQGGFTAGPPGPFTVLSHHHDRLTNANLVGTTDGKVGELVMGRSSDFTEQVAASVTTGYLDRKTSARKWCQCVRLTLRRGTSSSSSDTVGLLSYSDAPGSWSAPMPVSFGVSGDTTTEVEFRSLGVYRRRAWRFEFSGSVDLSLVRVAEEFTVLSQ